jgi:hypothetical protein
MSYKTLGRQRSRLYQTIPEFVRKYFGNTSVIGSRGWVTFRILHPDVINHHAANVIAVIRKVNIIQKMAIDFPAAGR